jgi:hypothetical protein
MQRGALAALVLIASAYSVSSVAAAPARLAPARPAPRYAPPPPPAFNALPTFELSGYYGPGNFKIGDDSGSESHSSSNFGIGGWGVVAQHLLLAVDYNHSSADFGGTTLKVGRWNYGLGYIGPMGRTSSWYVKAFGASHNFDCDSPCDGTDQSGGGVGAGFMFPFERNWTGQVDLAYTYLAEKDDGLVPALNVWAFGGKLQYKINRAVGLWAGINADLYNDSGDNNNNAYISLVAGRFGVSFDFY